MRKIILLDFWLVQLHFVIHHQGYIILPDFLLNQLVLFVLVVLQLPFFFDILGHHTYLLLEEFEYPIYVYYLHLCECQLLPQHLVHLGVAIPPDQPSGKYGQHRQYKDVQRPFDLLNLQVGDREGADAVSFTQVKP